MKKFKKVIPALCMLLVSAIMLGSTTYAWFSMNNQVTANGMSVSATANTQFLVISASQTLATDTTVTVNQKSGGINNGGTNVYPCAPVTVKDQPATGLNVGDWYTANSTDYTSSNTNLTNIKKIVEGELGNYHITYTFYIGLATGSDSYEGPLSLTATGYNTDTSAVRAIVKIGTQELTYTNSNSEHKWTTTSNVTLTAETAMAVTVTLYIDGTHETVKSSDYSSISGTLSFAVTATGITNTPPTTEG